MITGLESNRNNGRPSGAIHALIVGLGAAALVASIATAPAQAQVLWSGNGHYYEFVSNQVHWTVAKAAAEAATFENRYRGHLATIGSQEENDFIINALSGMGDTAWIGLSDAASEDSFQWVTGEPLVFTKWGAGQPDDAGGEDFVEFNFIGGQGDWNDLPNDFDGGRFYIIEYELAVGAPSLNLAAILVLALCLAAVAARLILRQRLRTEI